MRRVVNAEDYFDAAFELLAARGPRSVKVGALCAALGVTTGSFYGYFRSLNEFTDALLTARLSRQNSHLLALAEGVCAPSARVGRLRELVETMPHEAEAALRIWASESPSATQRQRELDLQRSSVFVEILSMVVVDAAVARQLADIGMALVIGWQMLSSSNRSELISDILDAFEELIWLNCDRADDTH